MERGHRRLSGVLAHWSLLERRGDQPGPLANQGTIPAGAVLIGQRDKCAVGFRARRAAPLGEEHEGEQPGHFGIVRRHVVEQAPEAVASEARSVEMEVGTATRLVPLVEGEIHHTEYRLESLGFGCVVGQRERLIRFGHSALGAADALRYRRLGDEEGRGDLPRGQPPSARSVRAIADAGASAGGST